MTAIVSSMPEAMSQDALRSSGPTPMPSVATSAKEMSDLVGHKEHEDGNAVLPELRSSINTIDNSKPLPTSLQSEFIPEEILSALTQLPSPGVKESLNPPNKLRTSPVQSKVKPKRPAANLWNFPRQRKRFEHLTNQPVSLKGAGRDISFLYDVAFVEPPLAKTHPGDASAVRIREKPKEGPMSVSDTLIPSEYHLVKAKGVQHLEFEEEKYTTKLKDDERKYVTFPSMKPTSRYEVLQLQETLKVMLEKAGVMNEDVEVKGPTQMHNLIELIKKEQNIYNIIFHELIRQVSVECAERGELLANVRELYNKLLDKVPRQIKSLHQEVMAQRALDRRLTEELFRFKSSIAELTNELSDVREHDKVVTSQAKDAQDQLAKALADSEKSASLLVEYHELYELQRKRLETNVFSLASERDQWSNAAYSLALKITEANTLSTARRLHITERAWSKLANHFTIVLSDRDTEQLSCLQGFIARHRALVMQFGDTLQKEDQKSRERLGQVRFGVDKWVNHFLGAVIASECIHTVLSAPTLEMIQALYDDIRFWEETLNKEVEKFGGDILLSHEDSLYQIQKQVDQWTETALQVFNRHKPGDGSDHPNQGKLEEMIQLTHECGILNKQNQVRINGENGTARGFIHIQNGMEAWDTKLNTILNGGAMPLEAEWSRLFELFHEWIQVIDGVDNLVGTTQKEEDRAEGKPHNVVDQGTVFQHAQKWLATTINGIDSQDSKLVEQVSVLHADMVHWMIQVLLRLAPDPKDSPPEIVESCMSTALSYSETRERAATLFDNLTAFSNYITSCCANIVSEEVQRKTKEGLENADHEFRDLKKIKTECAEWIHTAIILMEELKNAELAKLGGLVTPGYVASAGHELMEADDMTPDVASRAELVDVEMTPAPSAEPPSQFLSAPPSVPQTPAAASPSIPQTPGAAPLSLPLSPTAGQTREPSATVPRTTVTSAASQEINLHQMQILGHDQNVWTQSLEEPTRPPPPSTSLKAGTSGRATNTPDTNKAYEALAAVQTLQDQLLRAEERFQTAEERVAQLEDELLKVQEKLRDFERQSTTPQIETPAPEATKQEQAGAAPVEDKAPSKSGIPDVPAEKQQSSPTPPHTPKTGRQTQQRPASQASGRSGASSRASNKSKKNR